MQDSKRRSETLPAAPAGDEKDRGGNIDAAEREEHAISSRIRGRMPRSMGSDRARRATNFGAGPRMAPRSRSRAGDAMLRRCVVLDADDVRGGNWLREKGTRLLLDFEKPFTRATARLGGRRIVVEVAGRRSCDRIGARAPDDSCGWHGNGTGHGRSSWRRVRIRRDHVLERCERARAGERSAVRTRPRAHGITMERSGRAVSLRVAVAPTVGRSVRWKRVGAREAGDITDAETSSPAVL